MKRCLILCTACALAQDQSFRVETRVVQVPVTVTDAKGRNVEGLTARDFTVLDDNRPRQIAIDTFGTGAAPISLVVAVQNSAISAAALAKIRRVGGMIQPLVIGRRGEAAVLTFDSEIDWARDFSRSSDAIQNAMKSLSIGSPTQARMFDAILEAAGRMRPRPGRKVLLILAESRDRGSKAHLDEVLQTVERDGIEIFAASYSAYATAFADKSGELPPPSEANYLSVFTELARLGKTNDLQALTQATGGSDYPFLKERAIEKAIEKLGVDVHSQYILSFPPEAGHKGMHQIAVSLPGRGNLLIRARQAYWSD
ncbi:MAG: VWA domain-containing protein [Bryobacteraceae bacterium]|jgi:VWFA-related protein